MSGSLWERLYLAALPVVLEELHRADVGSGGPSNASRVHLVAVAASMSAAHADAGVREHTARYPSRAPALPWALLTTQERDELAARVVAGELALGELEAELSDAVQAELARRGTGGG